MEKIKLGIIGIGNMGTGHYNNIKAGNCPEVELVAIADTNPDRIKWAEENMAAEIKKFSTAEEMLDSGLINAALVAIPHYDHPKYAMACMERGIHVMVEKPAGVYTKQVREMNEVANILKNATSESLVILDEIGRGTSTFDGLSIAWAVVEHIVKSIGSKTLFATHYHELTVLEERMKGVKNYSVAVKKRGDDITFLRKIVEGGTDESFGIEVAKLAGVPGSVVKRAKEIAVVLEGNELSLNEISNKAKKVPEQKDENQIVFGNMNESEIMSRLKSMDVTTLTPIEAMNVLFELSAKAKNN